MSWINSLQDAVKIWDRNRIAVHLVGFVWLYIIAATENVHGPENKYFRSIHCVGATIAVITLYIPVIYICGNIFIRYIFEILVIEVNTLGY